MQRFISKLRLVGKFRLFSTNFNAMSFYSHILFSTRFYIQHSIQMIQQTFSFPFKFTNFSTFVIFFTFAVFATTQTACVNPKDTKVDIVIVDSIGNAKGEIAYVADNNNVYKLNAAGGGSSQLTNTNDATQVRFRNDRKQFTYIKTTGEPIVVNIDGTYPSFTNSVDYNNPKNYEYKESILYFFNSSAVIKTSDNTFNIAINAKINSLKQQPSDVIKYVTLLPNDDLVVILQNASPDNEIVWYNHSTNTARRYQPSGSLKQARFYNNGETIIIQTAKSILYWKNTENNPKPVFFTSNIRTFAINPTGTEIAYVKNDSEQNIVYVKNIAVDLKLDRKLPTKATAQILDIDWK